MADGTAMRKLRLQWLGLCPAAILAVAVLVSPLRAAEPVFPPGSKIGLAPPPGLRLSPDFAGFMSRETGTSIVITAMPKEAFDQLSVALTAEQLATQGMTLLGPCENVQTSFENRVHSQPLPDCAHIQRLIPE